MTESLIAFILTSVAIELTPGPNMAYLAILSLNRGRLAGAAAVAGVALGLALLGVGAALGLGSLIARVDWLYEALRWGGVMFLLWLAFDNWRDARRPIGTIAESTELAEAFRQGLVTNLLNPKAALFYTAVLPNFLEPERQGWEQSALLTAVYVLVATLIHAVVVLAADAVRPLIESANSATASVRSSPYCSSSWRCGWPSAHGACKRAPRCPAGITAEGRPPR